MTRIDDGHSTKISLVDGTTLWEKEVTPPGLTGAGAINTTTMRNAVFRTKAPKKLKELTDSAVTVAYDASAYSSILTNMLTNQEITITFPDGGTYVFWGWIESFEPDQLQEGEQPTASMVIIASNEDDSTPPVETAPVYTSA